MYNFNTDNETAIVLADNLRNLGIRKYYIHLLLYDKSLVGIDPFDEDNLSLEQKARIKAEIRKNIWFYLREIVRIRETGGLTRYEFHRGNLAQTFTFINNIDTIEILPRQNGKTIGACCNYSWLYNFASTNMSCIFSNKEFKDSKLNIERLKNVNIELPSYLKTHYNDKLDTDRLDKIRCDVNNNVIEAIPSAKDEASADKLGRGVTVAGFWNDEFAFFKHNRIMWNASSFAYSKAAESAEKNGVPHSRLITTTPNHLNCDEGAFCYSFITNGIKFDEHWYDYDINEVKDEIENTSKNGFVHIQFSYKELGKDEKWLEKQKKLVNYDLQTIKREIFLEWTLSGEGSIFDEETLDDIKTYVKEPIGSFYILGCYKFLIYEELSNIRDRNYIASIDIAAGLDEDSTVITIIDPITYKPAVIFKSNTIETPTLVQVLVELVENFFNNLVIVPERNNAGIAVIQMIQRSSIKDRLYYYYKSQENEGIKKVNNKKNRTKARDKNIKGVSDIKVYGINTTPKTRKIMIDEILNNVVNENRDNINNEFIFNELKTLYRNKNGKVEARVGFHDDVIMSYLIGLYTILYSPNIRAFLKVTWSSNDNNQTLLEHKEKAKKVKKTISNNLDILNNRVNDYDNHYYNLKKNKDKIEKETGLEMNDPIINKKNNNDRKNKRKNKINKRIKMLY